MPTACLEFLHYPSFPGQVSVSYCADPLTLETYILQHSQEFYLQSLAAFTILHNRTRHETMYHFFVNNFLTCCHGTISIAW
jgi:hypothetical protein